MKLKITHFRYLACVFFINSIPAQTLASTVLNRQKSASTMATKPPLSPPAAAAALPHTALPPSPQPRGCPPRPFPRIPVAVSPLCAAHTPSPTTTCELTLRHDNFSPLWAILKSSFASQPTLTPTMYHWSIGYAGGGWGARVDVYYHNKSPSTRVIASTEGSWMHYRAWSGCSSPDKPPCLQKSISNNQPSNWGRGSGGSGVYSAGLMNERERWAFSF